MRAINENRLEMKRHCMRILKQHSLFVILLFGVSFYSTAQRNAINVMPLPKTIGTGNGKLKISHQLKIELLGISDDSVLENAANRVFKKLNLATLAYFEQEKIKLNERLSDAIITIKVEEKKPNSIGVDESYKLSINSEKGVLLAKNTIGALRGMETLLQLIDADSEGYFFPEVEIYDEPRFKWRGMMVDVARHFIPLDILKRNIDAMAVVKMNILHLHLSDDEGFRVESKKYPRLHEFGSNKQYYSQEELKGLVQYAEARGIMIYPEFDLPGHSKSWFAGYPELASALGPYIPGPRFEINPNASTEERRVAIFESPTPAINPTKEEVYDFLDGFIGEMATIFPCPYYHIGADENNGKAWNLNPQIVQFMKDNNMKNVHELQKYFVKRIYTLLQKHNKRMIGWEEAFDENLPNAVTFQTWGGSGTFGGEHITLDKITGKGNTVVISTGFYLDLFQPASNHYKNSNILNKDNPNILGGEAALWSELVDEYTFEGRAWPRTAAIAERLWSPSNVIDQDEMYRRLFILSDRLEIAGLNHTINVRRMLTSLCNSQDVKYPLTILQTLTPKKGYFRLGINMRSPKRTKYQGVPLANLADMVTCDSKQVWSFKKLVDEYVSKKDLDLKEKIKAQLEEWIEAAGHIKNMTESAPNLNTLEGYAQRVAGASKIGLQVLTESVDQSQKKIIIEQLKSLARSTDELEIGILPVINQLCEN